MELFYVVFFICSFSYVQCDICDNSNRIVLEKYEVYLIGFSMLIMFLTTICLSIALYLIRNNITVFGININKKPIYIRQESTQGVSVRSYTNTVNDLPRNDSTLTVNSGIVEISGITEPETPIRLEPKDEKKVPCIKKPLMPIIPTMQKAQMDDIIKQVLLSKRSERGSTTLRELDAFTNQRTTEIDEKGSTFNDASANSNAFDAITNENYDDELLYVNLPSKPKSPSNSRELKKAGTSPLKEGDLVDGFANETHVKITDDNDVYDMLPNQVRCVEESSDYDNIKSAPVYDTPPRTSWDKGESNDAILDQDTNYLLLLSKNRHDDVTSYINARHRNTP
ncbi:unnamed protein product [Arctia plantaginis]|uniref:Uncharacterized protein n=1 Tax=Arctia plantaginis TaxID=874455 RepID=A0A8S1B8P0_ARCPL|nr:unnamed protein product [Arctia plantaginis]